MSHGNSQLLDYAIVPRSKFYDSPFGRLFDNLEPWVPVGENDQERERGLNDFAEQMFEPLDAGDGFDSRGIPAGYTYFGQFIDHDITFDPTSSLMRINDPNLIHNFRTPRLDLDSVYGAGPKVTPYLYDRKRKGRDGFAGFFLIETGEFDKEADLPRNSQGIALIGDPRNDENLIVSQVHLAFLKLHNRVLKSLVDGDDSRATESHFREAQRIVRWFYQYVVWHDFVKRIVNDQIHAEVLVKKDKDKVWELKNLFYDWKQAPYMPVEFSVAAYRFGHSQIRPSYQLNSRMGVGVAKPVFDPNGTGDDLHGGRRLLPMHTIQWNWFLRFAQPLPNFPQSSRKINTQLSRAVLRLPDGSGGFSSLAALNLRRGWRMELPSGPDVARAMGETPHEVSDNQQALWYYILHEAEMLRGDNSGEMLGRVGSRIVAEVFAGLLQGDSLSFFNIDPNWTPASQKHLPFYSPENGKTWEFADLIKAAGMPITGDEITAILP